MFTYFFASKSVKSSNVMFRGVCKISQGGGQLTDFGDFGYTCSETRGVCSWGFGGMLSPRKFLKVVQFCAF